MRPLTSVITTNGGAAVLVVVLVLVVVDGEVLVGGSVVISGITVLLTVVECNPGSVGSFSGAIEKGCVEVSTLLVMKGTSTSTILGCGSGSDGTRGGITVLDSGGGGGEGDVAAVGVTGDDDGTGVTVVV